MIVLETDNPMRATDLSLALHGREVAQITVQAGKSREVLKEQYPFAELLSSFKDGIAFSDSDHIAAGSYRFPFRFDLQGDYEPSIATSELAPVRGRFDNRPDGLWVEYELEARIEVPWWIDPIDRVVIPVYSTRRVLGAIPRMASPTSDEHPSFQLQFDAPMILPGTEVTGTYSVQNPRGKDLSELTLRVYRHIEYNARGRSAVRDGPESMISIPLGGRDVSYSGTFRVPIVNSGDATGPFRGSLYRTWWNAFAELKVSFGFDVRVEAAFTPA